MFKLLKQEEEIFQKKNGHKQMIFCWFFLWFVIHKGGKNIFCDMSLYTFFKEISQLLAGSAKEFSWQDQD